jgi:nicotinamidase-related amidase
MNTWENLRIAVEVSRHGKAKIVLAGLWTSDCIADTCGDISVEAHEMAIQRMVQLGARPMTSLQYLLELQRDWARTETYDAMVKTSIENGGAYGLGLIYAKTMFNASEGH